MDRLTATDYAQINADRARDEARAVSLKLDGLADILGYTPEELVARGKLVNEQREEREKKEREERNKKVEEEIQASGMTRGEWYLNRTVQMNVQTMSRFATQSMQKFSESNND